MALNDFTQSITEKFRHFCNVLYEEHGISIKDMTEVLTGEGFDEIKIDIKPVKSGALCEFPLKSGARKGQPCGAKVAEDSKCCNRHKKIAQVVAPIETDEIIFHRNKHGNLSYGKTGLILKSDTERFIIGKQDEHGNITDLDEDGINICKRKKIKYVKGYSRYVSPVAKDSTVLEI